MPIAKTASKKSHATKPTKAAKSPPTRLTLAAVMSELKKAGSAQTRKTYARHGAAEPMFGVSFATLKTMTKRIDVDHELALKLWDTGNFDARNLAVKIVDPARLTSDDLDRWARETSISRMCGGYVGMLACEGAHGAEKLEKWLESNDLAQRSCAWPLLGQLAMRDETLPDSFFEKRLAEIERKIRDAPNFERDGMNMSVIMIGCRNASLRKAALASAKRIGKVEIDHGDTSCKTADATEYIEKTWANAKSKNFSTPAEQERAREVPRRRC